MGIVQSLDLVPGSDLGNTVLQLVLMSSGLENLSRLIGNVVEVAEGTRRKGSNWQISSPMTCMGARSIVACGLLCPLVGERETL